MASGAFAYINNVLYGRGKANKVDGSYSKWLMNRALSMHPDTVYVAQILNEGISNIVSDDQHFAMVNDAVVQKKRRFCWPKKKPVDATAVDAMMLFYGYDRETATMELSFWDGGSVEQLLKDYKEFCK